jgi:hypothetical protein
MTAPIVLPIGGFKAESVLDQDRLATVWLVADERGRAAVLTIGHRVLVDDPGRTAFLDWARMLGTAAASPAIADLRASGITDDGRPYLAVATEPGTLSSRLSTGPISAADACRYGQVLAEGLAHAHATGLIHGAVRPATVLMAGDRPMLAGWGTTAPELGVPLPVDLYTAPEHLADALAGRLAAGQPADVYDLAITLLVALGGRLPWTDRPYDAAQRGLPLPAVAGVPTNLLALLEVCLAVDAAARPTAAAIARMLATIDPGIAAPSTATATVDPVGSKPKGIRRVAAIMGDELATSSASAVGGAVGTMTASKLLGPAPSGPAPAGPPAAAPPTAAQPGGAGVGSGGTGGSAGGAHSLVTSLAAKITVAVAVGAVAAGGAYAYRHSGDRSQGESTRGAASVTKTIRLSVQPDRGNFGSVWLGSKASHTYTITNKGPDGVTPEAAAVTGNGFTLKKDNCGGKVLPPQGTCTITKPRCAGAQFACTHRSAAPGGRPARLVLVSGEHARGHGEHDARSSNRSLYGLEPGQWRDYVGHLGASRPACISRPSISGSTTAVPHRSCHR